MKRLIRIVAVCLMCGSMAIPQFEMSAQGRRPGANGNTEHSSKPGGNSHNNGGSRPNNGNNNHQRPNTGNNNNHQRPNQGSNNNNHLRPNPGNNNNNNNNHYRPNPGNSSNLRPTPAPGRPGAANHNPKPQPAPVRPGVGNNHYRPNTGHNGVHHPTPPRPPHRPYRPSNFWSHRPTPPHSFRPHYRLTPLQAILGFAVGTAFNASLNYLYANNYTVDGYADNQLFLRNVNAYNTVWPDVVLNYANGVLVTSNFSYSTPYYDSSCYNRVFGVLNSTYGAPVSTVRQDNGWSATWWGYDNRYLTLDYRPYYAVDGSLRYYTTLTVG